MPAPCKRPAAAWQVADAGGKEARMTAKIIISSTEDETRMGLVENGILTEYTVERARESHLVGNIFKGRVSNVVPGIQAAFVDIGYEQNAFLYMDKKSSVTEGQSVLVQITKDPRGSKGPSATCEITLPGKYVVLLPHASYIGISRKITDKEERERLAAICAAARPEGAGIVVRTAAAGMEREALTAAIAELADEWKIISAREKIARAPALLRRELDLPVRMVRDYLQPGLEEILIDDDTVCRRVEELLQRLPQGQAIRLTRYRGAEDIFARYGYAEAIAAISDRRVPLAGGGYLVIDYTEAMTVIDVNSGAFSARENLEETIMEINRKAAREIARQLRLRDIGGIIVVDFIDMHTGAHKDEIVRLLERALAGDRMHPRVQDITVLNLVEITRKKARQNLSSVLYAPCPVCSGSGRIQSRETLALEIKRQLRTVLASHGSSKNVLIVANPCLAEWLRQKYLRQWERELACSLAVESNPALHPETFELLDNSGVDK